MQVYEINEKRFSSTEKNEDGTAKIIYHLNFYRVESIEEVYEMKKEFQSKSENAGLDYFSASLINI